MREICHCTARCPECGLPLDEERVVQIIPGTGWVVIHKDEDGWEYPWPLVAWGVDVTGNVAPLDTDPNGFVLGIGENDIVRPMLPGDLDVMAAVVRKWAAPPPEAGK